MVSCQTWVWFSDYRVSAEFVLEVQKKLVKNWLVIIIIIIIIIIIYYNFI